mgnify:FL=1
MRKAKTVEVPDRELTFDEFEKLRKHALNSATWYVDRYQWSRHRVRQRLADKGYTTEPVTYRDLDGTTHTCDIIEETLAALPSKGVPDDTDIASSRVWSLMDSGKSARFVTMKLRQCGFMDSDIQAAINDYLDHNPGHSEDVVDRAATKYVNRSVFRGEPDMYRRAQKLKSHMMSKSIDLDSVDTWIAEHPEYFTEDNN